MKLYEETVCYLETTIQKKKKNLHFKNKNSNKS